MIEQEVNLKHGYQGTHSLIHRTWQVHNAILVTTK